MMMMMMTMMMMMVVITIANATRYPRMPNLRPVVVARGCGIACPISDVHQTRATATWSFGMLLWIKFWSTSDLRFVDMFIKHMQNCVLCFQATVLHVF